ncbi:Prostatic acid phosphatase [Hondaea fermentalgiana]|uniref:Prostatic acid phosphatase n=1 Tax=Hondaea fermentalgiana TaxID=2315210 RepID=A0A2R5GJK6_9STRA|nr:Prostatic acid phosphatase [Hondaea fermentalgiana]|eukprot:GBG28044.1 Prostatic acid phosphatase [Hondaea fermentalgiana]
MTRALDDAHKDLAGAVAKGDYGNVVHLVFRHGARGPSKNAVAALEGTKIAESWPKEELEELTPHGLDQCVTLGECFGQAIVSAAKGDAAPPRVTWHSSPIDRTISSGKAFLEGLASVGALGEAPPSFDEPEPAGDHDPRLLYRGFTEVQEYKDALARLRAGPEFEAFGKEAEPRLVTIKPSLMDIFDTWAQRINVTTYMEELMDCEAARSADEPRVLHELNPPEVRETITGMAQWCWSKRFFELEECKTLAQPLLSYIQSTFVDTADAAPLHIYLHSAHDYSILLLLQQLGLESYPTGPTLGYGGFLVLGSNGKSALNPRPFHGRDLSVDSNAAVQVPGVPAPAI